MGVPHVLGRLACREESGSRWHLCHPLVTCCHPFHHCDAYVTHASDASPILPAYHPLTSSTAATCITEKLSILARSSTCRASRSVPGTPAGSTVTLGDTLVVQKGLQAQRGGR